MRLQTSRNVVSLLICLLVRCTHCLICFVRLVGLILSVYIALYFNKEKQMTIRLKRLTSQFVDDESGQDIVEYALLGAIIALGSVVAMSGVATKISTVFGTIGTKLTTNVT